MLASAERVLLRRQWHHTGGAIRYFNASSVRRADEKSANREEAKNEAKAPSRGISRQQRSKLIADQVSAVNQGPPPEVLPDRPAPDVSPAPPRIKTKTGDAFIETPTSTSPATDAGSRMGDNESSSRDGILAKDVGGSVKFGESAQGVANVLEASRREEITLDGSVTVTESIAPATSEPSPSRQTTSSPAEPRSPTKKRSKGRAEARRLASPWRSKFLFHNGHGHATIAANNFAGVLFDRLHQIKPFGKAPPTRTPAKSAEKSTDETVTDATADGLAFWQRRQRLSDNVRRSIVDRLVRGKYPGRRALEGTIKDKQTPVEKSLDTVNLLALKNISYFDHERRRILTKVRSILDPKGSTAAAAAAKATATKAPPPKSSPAAAAPKT